MKKAFLFILSLFFGINIIMGLLTGNVFGLYYWIFLLATSSPPNYVDFPLGQNKSITIDVGRNFVEKPYVISLRTEYPNAKGKKMA